MIAYEQKYTVAQDDPYLKEMREICTEENGWKISEDTTRVTFSTVTWLGEPREKQNEYLRWRNR